MKTFFSIIQARSLGINLTEMKTLKEKGMVIGLKKGEKRRRQTEAIIHEAEQK